MTSRKLNLSFEEYSDISQLDSHLSDLIALTKKAALKAYAPYSKFTVGTLVELANGQIFTGNNQENAAYPSGLCAERTTLFFANANYPDIPVKRIILVAYDNGIISKTPVYPCGACRQVMMETQDRFKEAIEIWMIGENFIHMVKSVDPLLPMKFTW